MKGYYENIQERPSGIPLCPKSGRTSGKKLASAYHDTVRVFKAFCDENRLRILEMLRTGEKCACKLLDDLHITQSTLSHHMKILCDAGIVQGRKDGKWVYYSISSEGADCARKLPGAAVVVGSLQRRKWELLR